MRFGLLMALSVILSGCLDWSEDHLRRDAAPSPDVADSQPPVDAAEAGGPDLAPDALGGLDADMALLDALPPDAPPPD